MMIGKIWRKYTTINRENKWALLGTFNVMGFFFYTASQGFLDVLKKDAAIKSLRYLKSIFENVCPKLLEKDEQNR